MYPSALGAFLTGQIDVLDGNLRAVAVDGRVQYDATHTTLADLDSDGFLGAVATFVDVEVATSHDAPASFATVGLTTGGSLSTTDTTNLANARALVVMHGDGTGTSLLICYLGLRADESQVDDSTNSGGQTWQFPNGIFTV